MPYVLEGRKYSKPKLFLLGNKFTTKKAQLFFLALLVSISAPAPNKPFHEHIEDFIQVILQKREDLNAIAGSYMAQNEFRESIAFISNTDIIELMSQVESLPEFKAVAQFLEKEKIDLLYFMGRIENAIESVETSETNKALQLSGRDLTSFMKDCIAIIPKDQVAKLFDKKMSEDKDFKTTIINLQSEEFISKLKALFENENFQRETKILAENGIKIDEMSKQMTSLFGPN